jgi:hypothetical protein
MFFSNVLRRMYLTQVALHRETLHNYYYYNKRITVGTILQDIGIKIPRIPIETKLLPPPSSTLPSCFLLLKNQGK